MMDRQTPGTDDSDQTAVHRQFALGLITEDELRRVLRERRGLGPIAPGGGENLPEPVALRPDPTPHPPKADAQLITSLRAENAALRALLQQAIGGMLSSCRISGGNTVPVRERKTCPCCDVWSTRLAELEGEEARR